MCVLGKRLVKDISLEHCNKTVGGPLHELYCSNTSSCDPYYETHNVSIVRGIKGLASGVFMGMCSYLNLMYRSTYTVYL